MLKTRLNMVDRIEITTLINRCHNYSYHKNAKPCQDSNSGRV
jgi:hypothetical protein